MSHGFDVEEAVYESGGSTRPRLDEGEPATQWALFQPDGTRIGVLVRQGPALGFVGDEAADDYGWVYAILNGPLPAPAAVGAVLRSAIHSPPVDGPWAP